MKNIAHNPIDTSSLRSRRLWIFRAFALLWAIFYFATPLDPRFTVSDTFNQYKGDVSDEDRAELAASATAQGSLAREMSLATLALFGGACLMLPSEQHMRIRGLTGLLIVGFLAWAMASVLWSSEIGTTLRRLAVLLCLSIAALGVAKQFSLRQIVYFTVFAGGVLLVAGFVSELALGTFQPLDPEYRFSGLTMWGFDGWMLSLLLLGGAVLYPAAGRYRGALIALCIAALGAAVMTKTRASTAGLVAGAAVFSALTWPSRRVLLVSLGSVACIAAGIMVLSLTTPNAGDELIDVVNLGRAESAEGISGRSALWEDIMPFIADRPLIGYGYDSFWTPDHLVQIGDDNWGASNGHNVCIDLTLGVGLIGAAAYVLALLSGFCSAWARSIKTRSADYAFACGAIVISAINTSFVSNQLAPSLYTFITLVVLAHLGFIAEPSGKAVLLS